MAETPLLVVVTPWYPTEQQPYKAAFVREWTATLGLDPTRVVTIHLDNVEPGESDAVTRTTDAVGTVLRIPVVAPSNTARDKMAHLFARRLEEHGAELLKQAPAVHAHVALPSGWGVLGLLGPDTKLTYIEHASYLPTLLRAAETKKLVGAVVERAQVVLTPGAREAQLLRGHFTQHSAKVQSVGNPLDFSSIPQRREAVSTLNRWLTLSNLVPLKRVDEALRAFALWQHNNAEARLTVAGAGIEFEALQTLAAELNIADKVDFRGAVPREEVSALLQEHDLLVHLSGRETFAIAPLEAIGAGLALVITECGGPEETLFLARHSDQVSFVSRQCTAAEVNAAVSQLAGQLPVSSGAANRAELVYRYDAANFGPRLTRTLHGELPLLPPDGSGGHYAVIATAPAEIPQYVDLFQALLSREAQCYLVTPESDDYRSRDHRLNLVEIPLGAATTGRIGLQVWLRAGLAISLLRVLRLGAKVATKLPGPLAKVGRGVRRKVDQIVSELRRRGAQLRFEKSCRALEKLLSSPGASGAQARAQIGAALSGETQIVLLSQQGAAQYRAFSDAGLSHSAVELSELTAGL